MTDSANLSRVLPYIGIGAVVAGNITANVFIKLGANAPTDRALIFGIVGWQTVVGIGFFGASVLLYAWVLKQIPLHLAQSIAVLQFVGVILAAAVFFDEAISIRQWGGIGLIILGLIVVAR